MQSISFDRTVEHLAARWQHADKLFLRQLFPLLSLGRPISPTRLSQLTGETIATVDQKLQKGRTDRDFQGNVVELFGIMQSPTLHRIQVGQVCLFSCCALVAQMVPLLIKKTATVESVDPISHKLIRLQVSPTGVQTVEPTGSVGTLVVTSQEEVLKDVRSAFCSHVCLFPDTETAQEFISADSRRYIVDIQQFHEAARQLTLAIWD